MECEYINYFIIFIVFRMCDDQYNKNIQNIMLMPVSVNTLQLKKLRKFRS